MWHWRLAVDNSALLLEDKLHLKILLKTVEHFYLNCSYFSILLFYRNFDHIYETFCAIFFFKNIKKQLLDRKLLNGSIVLFIH